MRIRRFGFFFFLFSWKIARWHQHVSYNNILKAIHKRLTGILTTKFQLTHVKYCVSNDISKNRSLAEQLQLLKQKQKRKRKLWIIYGCNPLSFNFHITILLALRRFFLWFQLILFLCFFFKLGFTLPCSLNCL